jgi:uncharacterized protein YjbJ (UPF0337 family)
VSQAQGRQPVPKETEPMNIDRMQGSWKILEGRLRERWGKLTDDDLDIVRGRRDQLAGRIQRAYGLSQDEAEKQVKEFERTL